MIAGFPPISNLSAMTPVWERITETGSVGLPRGVPWSRSPQTPPTPPTVLIVRGEVDDRQSLRTMLGQENYRLLELDRCQEALRFLEHHSADLIILDGLPEHDGLECCRSIKHNPGTELTPVIVLAASATLQTQIAGLGSGADEFLSKPIHPELFLTRTRSLLRQKAAVDRLEESEAILFTLAQAVEKRDHYTAGHCARLARVSVVLGTAMGLPSEHLIALHRGGYLHDIGKVSIPDAILFKSGALDECEWSIMRTHPVKGEQICSPLRSLRSVVPIVRSHHERWDGSGYPDGLSGVQIPLLARILQLADIYDALTTIRPYKNAFSSKEALQIMADETARGWRDPDLFSLFADLQQKWHSELPDPDDAGVAHSLQNMSHRLIEESRAHC